MKKILLWVLVSLVWTCACGAGEQPDDEAVFRFAGGEQVLIYMFGNEGMKEFANQTVYQQPQVVSTDGFVGTPGSGAVNIKGKTLQEATDLIVEKIKSALKLKTPQVLVSIISMPPLWVYVQGEVTRPQQIEMPKGYTLYLSSALASGGGPTPDADLTQVQVIHADTTRKAPVDEVFDMSTAHTGKMPRGPALKPGDVVVVLRSEAYAVTGEVTKPGLFGRGDSRVKSGNPIRLTDALSAAGGVKQSADLQAIRLLRFAEQGAEAKVLTFNAQAAMEKGDLSQNPVIQDGDKIMVSSNDGYMLLGRVKTPGVYYAPGVGGGPLMLSRLIALGGGFETYAKKSSVIIVRKEKPGATTVVDVKSIIEEGKLEKDVPLSPGDMVFVGESTL
jgi:protein involved in polysaccharide export with SLBB domain